MNIDQFIRYHPTIVCQADLVEICKPLQKLNIVYFAHVHIDEKSNMSGISSCPEYFKIYFNNNFYQYDLHMANLSREKSYIIWDTIQRTKQSKIMHHYFTQLNRDHTFSIVKSSKTTKDYYHFAVKNEHDFMNNRYLQLLEELHCFINYFTEQVNTNKQLKLAYKMKISINKQLGGFFFNGQLQNDAFKDFYNEIKTKHFYFNHIEYLTKRELECLYWISKGKTATEIAIILQITDRTIKEHFKNIKQKLNCQTLFQLGMVYNDYFRTNTTTLITS